MKIYKILFSFMIATLIMAFLYQIKHNIGIVGELGIEFAILYSIAAMISGLAIGIILVKIFAKC